MSRVTTKNQLFYLKVFKIHGMKKLILVPLFVIQVFAACNNDGEAEPVAKDSAHKNSADSFGYNPAVEPAKNSDDPVRFSQ